MGVRVAPKLTYSSFPMNEEEAEDAGEAVGAPINELLGDSVGVYVCGGIAGIDGEGAAMKLFGAFCVVVACGI